MRGPDVLLPRPAPGSGRYHYALNGSPSGVEESFEVTGDDRHWSVTSVRTAPGGVELTVGVEAYGALDATCTVDFRTGDVERFAEYRLRDGALAVALDGSRPEAVTGEGRHTAVLSPLMRVFQGPAIAETMRGGGRRPVVIPALDPADRDALLAPVVELRTAVRLGVEAVGEAEDEVLWRHCRYVGGNYDDAADFWLDDRDRLVRYRFPQRPGQLWEVELAAD
jgi:hypothetical protein